MEKAQAEKKAKTSFLKEFRDFAVKGNMLDMAVGIIIGTAFNRAVNTMVKKVIMPPLSVMTDGVHISDRKYVLRKAVGDVEEIAIEYGEMIEALIDFLIIAFTVFLFIKVFNSLREKAYETRIIAETTKLKEALGEVVAAEPEPLPQPQPQTKAEQLATEEVQLLTRIEKLLEMQNELLQKNK